MPEQLLKVNLPSGNEAVYRAVPDLTSEDIRRYGVLVATKFPTGWLTNASSFTKPPTPEEVAGFEAMPYVDT